MRYLEIISGLRLPVSGEEQEIIDLVGTGFTPAADLDERQAEVARLMVSKGLLHRLQQDDQIMLSVNSAADAWRF